MPQHIVLRVISKLLMPFVLLFALYVQFHGDFGPGGGFQAGVIFGAGFILYALVYGIDMARQVARGWVLRLVMAFGLLLYGGVGYANLLLGGNFLDYATFDSHNPAHGEHLGILLVELGVGITVAATMVTIFFAFAARGRD
jgi:multicomponent Na+:H+ antiporter subunit B